MSASFRPFLLAVPVSVLVLMAGCSSGSTSSGGGGTIATQLPAISSINPTKLNAGAAALTLSVSGSGFTSASVVQVGSSFEATTYVSATQLTAVVPASQLTNGAQLPVAVANGTNSSSTINLEVDNPAPVISSTSTTTLLAGTPSAVITSSSATSITHGNGNTMITLTGSNFLPGVAVTLNGAYRTTTIVDSNHVTLAVPASDFATAGTASLVATNPGAPASNALSISIK